MNHRVEHWPEFELQNTCKTGHFSAHLCNSCIHSYCEMQVETGKSPAAGGLASLLRTGKTAKKPCYIQGRRQGKTPELVP